MSTHDLKLTGAQQVLERFAELRRCKQGAFALYQVETIDNAIDIVYEIS